MKETKQERYTIKYKVTNVEELTYNILAESAEDAKKKIQDNCGYDCSRVSVSYEVVEIK